MNACVSESSSSSSSSSCSSRRTSNENLDSSMSSLYSSSSTPPSGDVLHKSSGWDSKINKLETGWKSLKDSATQFFNSKAWDVIKSAPMVFCAAAVLIGMLPVTLLILGVSYFCFNYDESFVSPQRPQSVAN